MPKDTKDRTNATTEDLAKLMIRIPPKLKTALDEAAYKARLTTSEFVRRMLVEQLKFKGYVTPPMADRKITAVKNQAQPVKTRAKAVTTVKSKAGIGGVERSRKVTTAPTARKAQVTTPTASPRARKQKELVTTG